jgi:hypothetical protein
MFSSGRSHWMSCHEIGDFVLVILVGKIYIERGQKAFAMMTFTYFS